MSNFALYNNILSPMKLPSNFNVDTQLYVKNIIFTTIIRPSAVQLYVKMQFLRPSFGHLPSNFALCNIILQHQNKLAICLPTFYLIM